MEAGSQCFSEIEEYFRGKSVFITGGTGFLGKSIIEKILRSCPDVESIYVLIREKRGADVYSRLDNLMNEPIFDHLRQLSPHATAKVVAIGGDITLPGLGISQDNLDLLRKTVSVVIHSAATVKFEEPLNVAINANLEGTSQVLDLAETMDLIEAVVYVSTAFSNCERPFIEEKVYPVNTNPKTAINMYHTFDRELLETMTPMLIGDKPNTYVLTKHLAEELVNQRKMAVPVCIVRPSIITGTYNHPIPGFADNFNAMSGLLAGIMTGTIHTLLFNSEYKLDIIPLDYVANLVIAAAYRLGKSPDRSELKIYNLTSCSNPYVVTETKDLVFDTIYRNPLSRILWYPFLTLTTSPSLFRVLNLLFHRLPAHVGDFVLGVTGGKKMLTPIYHKLSKSIDVLQYFCTHIWKFSDDNTEELYQSLPSNDKINFPFNVRDIDWNEYMEDYVHGMRKYAFKEKISNVDEASKRLHKAKILHNFAKCLILGPVMMGVCILIKSWLL